MPIFMIADTTKSERQIELDETSKQRKLHDEESRELRSMTKARVERVAEEIRRILGEDVHLNLLYNVNTVLADLTKGQAAMIRTQLPHLIFAGDSPLALPEEIIEAPPEAR